MYSKDFGSNLVVKEVSQAELAAVLNQHFDEVYNNRSEAKPHWVVDEDSREKIKAREKEMLRYRLRLVVYSEDQVAGWHYGYSTDAETYYMQNSAVLATFRNKGIYGKLLQATLERLADDGFQVVSSTHHPNNAAVLIPKLKKGFMISSMLIHERFRFLVELKYFFNEERKNSFQKQIGLSL